MQTGRILAPDAEPEKGTYYRSDHFEFAKEGVPALNAKGGIDYRDKPPGYGKQKHEYYTANDYHKVSDEVKPDWDLVGRDRGYQALDDGWLSGCPRRQVPRMETGNRIPGET